MTEYTPTEGAAAGAYTVGQEVMNPNLKEDHRAGFHRWLAEVRREAAEKAWDEGERHESEHLSVFGQFCPHGPQCNPYRKEQS